LQGSDVPLINTKGLRKLVFELRAFKDMKFSKENKRTMVARACHGQI